MTVELSVDIEALDKAFGEADEGGIDILPVGNYVGEVTNVTVEDAKDERPARVVFEYTVVDGELKGRKIWDNCALTNSQVWKLKRTASVLDLPRDSLQDAIANAPEARGAFVEFGVKHNTYKDKVYANVNLKKRIEAPTLEGDAPF